MKSLEHIQHHAIRYSQEDINRVLRLPPGIPPAVLSFQSLAAAFAAHHPEYQDRIERDGKLAVRLYPFAGPPDATAPRIIAIDPRYGLGCPIIARTNLRIDVMVDRFAAGDSVEQLVADYPGVTREEVEEGIRYYTVTR